MRRNVLTALITAAVIVAVLVLARGSGQSLFGWSFVESAHVDRGTYFRLKVKLAYKDEPQDFDIVVGCNAVQINYKDGSRTSEVGLVPTVYGRRLSDGKGLVVRPPNACRGETTANGEVPTNFMPIVVVYDDADTLGFGTAYVSDEAYEGPLSELTFGGATIEAATREAFDTFRRDGPPNLVSRESYHSHQPDDIVEKMGLTKVYPPFGRVCYAYRRFLIPASVKDHVRSYWPESRPDYWMPDYPLLTEAFGSLRDVPMQRDTGGPFMANRFFWTGDKTNDRGVMRSSGGGVIWGEAEGDAVNSSFYPIDGALTAWARWPTDPEAWLGFIEQQPEPIVATNVTVRNGQARGFAHCFTKMGRYYDEAGKRLREKRAIYTVDDDPIEGAPQIWRATFLPSFAYRDEYLFLFTNIYLDSVRGDV